MLLVIEVGNTNTKIGVFNGPRLLASWRLTTRREQTADEYGVFIQTLLSTRGIERPQFTGVAISNVVPPVQQALEAMADSYFGIQPFTVEPGRIDAVPLLVDAPHEVGADRLCDIAPGLITASEALISRTARLYRVELLQPKEAIGRNTITNIQSGVMYGWAGLVDGLVDRMRSELGAQVKVVATGGLGEQMRGVSRCIDLVDPDLTLQGLRTIWEMAHPTNVR